MNIMDRIILTVYMLAMAAISFCAILLPFNLIPSSYFDMVRDQLYSNWYYSFAGLILFLVSLKLLLSGIVSNNKTKKGIIKPSEFGDVKISIETFESLALRTVKQVAGIKDVKINVVVNNEDLIVYTRLLVIPDINIPRTVSEVQGKIKTHIESVTEVPVKEVKVLVDNIALTSAAKID